MSGVCELWDEGRTVRRVAWRNAELYTHSDSSLDEERKRKRLQIAPHLAEFRFNLVGHGAVPASENGFFATNC